MPHAQIPMLRNFGRQYNIMAFVGNGFDVQVMHEYRQSPTTRYQDFYHFMKMKGIDSSNLLLQEMEGALAGGKADWSDVEACIASLETSGAQVEDIRRSLDDVRRCFAEFLNVAVNTSLLSQLSDDAQKNGWAKKSLSHFLMDIERASDLRKVPFGMKKGNYDLYNFYFVNFNYTSLLDDYIYMDPEQFDPVPHATVDTNFTFNTDPRKLSGDSWNFESSSYVEMQVVHPHGYQDIPRSLLFGTNGDGNPRSPGAKLAKTYWARVEQRYAHLFDDTDVFILFGCSLGATDAWWWEHIAASLLAADDANGDNRRALLIYWWNPDSSVKRTEDEIRDQFLDTAGVASELRAEMTGKIGVISYSDADERVWLSTARS